MVTYNRLSLSGPMPGGERWSVGWAYKGVLAALPDEVIESYEDLNSQAEHVWDVIEDWPATFALMRLLTTTCGIDTVRWEYREDAELVQAAEVNRSPVFGTNSMTKVFQTSLCFSMLTGRPGRAYRGRTYWPALSAQINSDTGRLSVPTIEDAATDMASALNDFGDRSLDWDLKPMVYSPSLGIVTEVTTVQVGNVLDTQRRRRDALVEERFSAPL